MKKMKMYASAALSLVAMVACNSPEKKTDTGGIDLASLDTTALPGTDFYQYACGGWIAQHPLTAEFSRYGTFDKLREDNDVKVQSLIEELAKGKHEAGSVAQKIGDLYNIAMDSVKLNSDGAAPIQTQLQEIAALTNKEDIIGYVATMARNGISTYFNAFVSADAMNSTMNIFQMEQGGINLGERDYYLNTDSLSLDIRTKYETYIGKLFTLAGFDAAVAAQKAKDVLEIETAIAKESKSSAELRDPMANYNKYIYKGFQEVFAGLQWDKYLSTLGIKDVEVINVQQPRAIQEVIRLIKTLPIEKHKAYLEYNLIDAATAYLSDDFVAASFDFYGKTLSGKEANRPRWKRSVSTVNQALGEAVGKLYVEKHFPAAAKERMVKLVDNLSVALGERIQAQEWMSTETKAKAMEKLATFHVKIGYPEKWKDYSTLEIKNDSYWANICRAAQWETADNLSRVGKPVDKDEWLMTPQTVNAYYNPTTNEICFPAAILQYPFFDMEADDAFNYGAIGVVIGHEMTHGFDDQGRQFDKDGNLKEWWTAEDAAGFNTRAQVMVDFFNNINVLPDLKANGKFTLGENLADHGGIKVSYLAFQNATKNNPLPVKAGFTPEQRFFLAYAALWAGSVRDEQIRVFTKTDPHSLGKWRVNGALPHIDAWYEAFGITEKDPLYIAPEKRAKVW
ncbi:MAG: M13 family metallopeptidase [Phocaeicola sp.]|nr:M13 family metallopeptidase [Prevotellaceae bacterium]MDY3915088.1 M13 family metallopeptidase [Phocaeicola sp.]MDY5939977.1 M13 family metallopeptidase [Phocaeicola sp.]